MTLDELLDRATVLRIEPGSVLVFRLPGDWPGDVDELYELADHLQEVVADRHPVVLVVGETSLAELPIAELRDLLREAEASARRNAPPPQEETLPWPPPVMCDPL